MVTVNGIIDLVEKARSSSTKRNLIQSFELIMTLKDLDTKKNELNINETVFLPNPLSRQTKICVFASGDLGLRAEKAKVDRVIQPDEIDLIGGNKRELRKIVRSYDFFLGETTMMANIGKVLGRFLGPMGKMPAPIPPNAPIENMISKYRTAVRIRVRNQLAVATRVGDEQLDDAKVAENAMVAFNIIIGKLPNAEKNLKKVAIKLSMSPPVKALATQVS